MTKPDTYEQEITTYSEKMPGERANHYWSVRFDNTGPEHYAHEPGYIGITQFDENGHLKDRILLSPAQMKTLIEFSRKLRKP